LGGKPRHQAVGHVLGIFVGGFIAVPTFYALFHGDLSLLTSEKLPLPGATIWKAVAEALTHGLHALHPTAQWAAGIGALIGILCEVCDQRMRGRFPLSAVGLGLGFVLRFPDALSMALGGVFFWAIRRTWKDPNSLPYQVAVENQETLCAGIIAGGSLVGMGLILLECLT
jgi:uncharacterized oligopeptide transporter (OPT) family protein